MKQVHIPKMGMSTMEVDIVAIHVGPGSRVRVGDPLIDIEGDKASFTIEAELAGVVLEVLVEEGAVGNVGDIVMHIEPAAD